MTLTDIVKDPATLSLVVTAEFAAPIDRVWQLWSDPRQLERWWGPPSHPATVTAHDLTEGGRVEYFMTGPEGDRHYGWWEITSVTAPDRLEFRDGFADDQGRPHDELPVTVMRVRLDETGGTTRVVMTSTFPSIEAMEQLVAMGMEDGLRQAIGQMDDVLAA